MIILVLVTVESYCYKKYLIHLLPTVRFRMKFKNECYKSMCQNKEIKTSTFTDNCFRLLPSFTDLALSHTVKTKVFDEKYDSRFIDDQRQISLPIFTHKQIAIKSNIRKTLMLNHRAF